MFFMPGDRRKYKRYTIDLMVDCAFAGLLEDMVEKGIIRNIGYRGLKLEAVKKPGKGAHFVVAIKSEELGIDITISGKVKWTKAHNGTASYGIEINWVSDEEVYNRYISILEAADNIC